MIHVGVDLHQRFCYVTVMDAGGRILQQRAVGNEAKSCGGGRGRCLRRGKGKLRQFVHPVCHGPVVPRALSQMGRRSSE